jgi:hypothetical protein
VWTGPFVLAVCLVGGAAALDAAVTNLYGLRRVKSRLELRRELYEFDQSKLGPYKVLQRHTFPPETVDALGTDQYLSWLMEDTRLAQDDPLRYIQLDVTYYSGSGELAPHTADVCRRGMGYERAQPHENTTIDVSNVRDDLPVRLCTFQKTAIFSEERVSVIYTFYCNGQFVETPFAVRTRMSTPGNHYGFFSKVEISFIRATREESLEGAPGVLQYALPVLIEQHWPDFEAAERQFGSSTPG